MMKLMANMLLAIFLSLVLSAAPSNAQVGEFSSAKTSNDLVLQFQNQSRNFVAELRKLGSEDKCDNIIWSNIDRVGADALLSVQKHQQFLQALLHFIIIDSYLRIAYAAITTGCFDRAEGIYGAIRAENSVFADNTAVINRLVDSGLQSVDLARRNPGAFPGMRR